MAPAKNVAEQELRLVRPDNPAAALGRAVSYLMTKPAFAKLQFGDWSRILVGQINRKHFCFVVDGAGQVQGFMGWALASEEHAKAWAEGRRALTFEDSLQRRLHGGQRVRRPNSNAVTRFLVEEARRIASDKTAIYFKRHYKDGTGARRASADQRVRRQPHRAQQRALGRCIRSLAHHHLISRRPRAMTPSTWSVACAWAHAVCASVSGHVDKCDRHHTNPIVTEASCPRAELRACASD